MNFKLLSIIMIILLLVMITGVLLVLFKLNSFTTACDVCEGMFGRTCLNITIPS